MRRRLLVFLVALMALPATAETRVVRDVVYGSQSPDAKLNSLDLYLPEGRGPHPIVVFVHGGGWTFGDKRHDQPRGHFFAGQGYLYVAVNYRLSPAVRHPAHVEDVARAIAWVRKNAGKYGGDPERIFVMGHSAGAHLAGLVATDERYLKAVGVPLTALRGAILSDGAGYDIPANMRTARGRLRQWYLGAFGEEEDGWREASPITYVAAGKGIPPFLLLTAGQRQASRLQAEKLASALRAAGTPAEVAGFPQKNHMTINREIGQPGDGPTRKILEFLGR